MTEPTDPNWNLLPHDPAGFFALQPDFDRTALKRAYNRLLRIYKPEKYPDEFQRLRAAFEQLDNGLRYGLSQVATPVPDPAAWTNTRAAEFKSTEHTVDWADRLLDEEPRLIFRELAQLERRTPYENYVMAVLSDTFVDESPLRFLRCVLKGLREHPDDPGLTSLLYRYLREPLPFEQIPTILKLISKTVRTDRYYALTEPLWVILLRSARFQKFEQLLTECERNLRAFRIESRLTFYVHLLRPALFRATPEWIDETFAFVNENGRELPPWLEYELEILSALQVYAESRQAFLERHRLFHRLDSVVRTYAVGNSVEFDQAFIACQVDIASSPRDWMEAVDFPATLDLEVILFLWQCFRQEVLERNGIANGDDEPGLDLSEGIIDQTNRRQVRKARALMRVIDARSNSCFRGRIWNTLGWSFGLLSIGGIYVLIFVTALAVTVWAGLAGPVCGIISLALAALGYPILKGLESLWTRFCIHSAIELHRKVWRAEIFDFIGRTRLGREDLVGMLGMLPEDPHSYTQFVFNFVLRDDAIDIYASAQDFLS